MDEVSFPFIIDSTIANMYRIHRMTTTVCDIFFGVNVILLRRCLSKRTRTLVLFHLSLFDNCVYKCDKFNRCSLFCKQTHRSRCYFDISKCSLSSTAVNCHCHPFLLLFFFLTSPSNVTEFSMTFLHIYNFH